MLIKAAAGGGGKGMRVCRDEANLASALQMARNEAEAAFKNPSVYLEKFIDRPRHVEVQILADSHGNVVHCWDRDCSLQRRHQKLVEESPAPTLPLEVRTQLGEAAVRLARTVGYVNAGTCEFLVDADNKFYFIEVNARIQVEHPVTEMVTGIDLVKQQIRIAAGEPLPFRQEDIVTRGHAIECRINSEDPDNDFRPSPGRITALRVPGGPGVRWDSHVQAGYTVPPNYDSLLGKLIVHAPTRARGHRDGCAGRSTSWSIEGVKTTIPLHRRIFRDTGLHRRPRRHDLGRARPHPAGPLAHVGETPRCWPGEPLDSSAGRPGPYWLGPSLVVLSSGMFRGSAAAGDRRAGRMDARTLQAGGSAGCEHGNCQMKVGLLTGGGDCPGLNAVIRAVVRRICQCGWDCLGILEGWRGLVRNLTHARSRSRRPTASSAREGPSSARRGPTPTRTRRPTWPPSARTSRRSASTPWWSSAGTTPSASPSASTTISSCRSSASPRRSTTTCQVADFSFGFDTAVNVVTEAVDRLRTTTESHRRIMVVETMGRHSGWIACFAGMAVGGRLHPRPRGPDRPAPPDRRAHPPARRPARSSASWSSPKGPGSPTRSRWRSTTHPDPFGNLRLGGIASVIAEAIEKQTGIETRSVVLGHLQRGGPPPRRPRAGHPAGPGGQPARAPAALRDRRHAQGGTDHRGRADDRGRHHRGRSICPTTMKRPHSSIESGPRSGAPASSFDAGHHRCPPGSFPSFSTRQGQSFLKGRP